jgi:inorganic pyrophosphatase
LRNPAQCRKIHPAGARTGAFFSPPRTRASAGNAEEVQMNLDRVSSGDNVPNEVNVIIEIPANSDPVKYELDKTTGAMYVDRFMSTAMYYPCNYGYIPRTLSKDGDPVDVLVLTPNPLIPGSVIKCRPVGVLKMTDESGDDAKVLCVPVDKLSKTYRSVESFRDLTGEILNRIAHFFEHYKDLDEGKWVRVDGWYGVDEAKQEILDSLKMYEEAPERPAF